ncbi:hypothetical protein J6590_101604, partial [Homalodisca vitripennis]
WRIVPGTSSGWGSSPVTSSPVGRLPDSANRKNTRLTRLHANYLIPEFLTSKPTSGRGGGSFET